MSDSSADLLQIPVRRPEHLETTSLGAAFAAGIATGFWTKEWVLGSASDDYTDFLPKVYTGNMTSGCFVLWTWKRSIIAG